MSTDIVTDLIATRVHTPGRVAELMQQRTRPTSLVGESGRLMLVAADHPARGALRAGDDAMAMADRGDLLRRLMIALERPGVDGVLGTADILEDLLLLGALEGKVVIGSMNRGGLAGTSFEIDDRFTAYSADRIARAGFEGGKMLLRIDPEDARHGPHPDRLRRGHRRLGRPRADGDGRAVHLPSRRRAGAQRPERPRRSSVRRRWRPDSAGTSAYTWLKLPVVEDMDDVLAATTLPVLLLGGEVADDQERQFALWEKVLANPHVTGMVVGRSLLYPPDGDVAAAVDATVGMI